MTEEQTGAGDAPQPEEAITKSDPPPPESGPRRAWRRLAFSAPALVLCAIYWIVGDTTWWGEFVTVWPPVLWWALVLVPVALPALVTPPRRDAWAPLLCGLLFIASTEDWQSLVRLGAEPQPGARHIRVITWNTDSYSGGKRAVLDALEAHTPDIVCLQETGDGESSLQPEDLTGYWSGFHHVDSGDCAVLCRWPLRQMPTRPVGPWEEPLVVAADLPSSVTAVIVNVRLMLPSLVLNPLPGDNRRKLIADHAARTAQFGSLAQLVEETAPATTTGTLGLLLLAGDFNTHGRAKSLAPIRTRFTDCWQLGHGWGGTITRGFPVARIDHLWLLDRCWHKCAYARTLDLGLSDHRAVLAVLRPKRKDDMVRILPW